MDYELGDHLSSKATDLIYGHYDGASDSMGRGETEGKRGCECGLVTSTRIAPCRGQCINDEDVKVDEAIGTSAVRIYQWWWIRI